MTTKSVLFPENQEQSKGLILGPCKVKAKLWGQEQVDFGQWIFPKFGIRTKTSPDNIKM